MQSNLFNCSICFQQFDKGARKPKILPKCGHTICLFCLETILKASKPKCPLDRQFLETNLELFATNLLLLQLIDEKSKLTDEACSLHKEVKNLVCMDDKCRICKSCSNHKGHEIKHINDLQKKTNIRRRELEVIINQIENEETTLYDSLDENRRSLLRANQMKFNSLREMLNQKEEGLEVEIETFFMLEKLEFNRRFREYQTLKLDLKSKVSSLNDNEIGEKFFKAIAMEEEATRVEYKEGLSFGFLQNIEGFTRDLNDKLNNFHLKLTQIAEEEIMDTKAGVYKNHSIEEISKTILKLEEKDERLVISPFIRQQVDQEGDLSQSVDFLNNNKVTLNLKKTMLTKDLIQAIFSTWEKLDEKVTDLKIDLSLQDLTNEELVDYCSLFIWLGRNVNTFELALRDCCIEDRGLIKLINQRMILMKNLKGIKLQLPGTQITDDTIEVLSKFISSRRENIEVFYLNVSGRPITDSSIEMLCSCLRPEMKSFGLVLNNTKIWDGAIDSIVQHVLPLSTRWETLCLHFFGTSVSENAFEKLLQNLKSKVGSLQSFIFEIGKTKVTAKSVQFLLDHVLPCLDNNLERLQLGLGLLQLDETTVKKIFQALHPKVGEQLKLFALSLDMNKVGDQNLEYLARDILSEFGSLENLLLTFSNCLLTDSSVKPLLASLKPLAQSLKQLTIRLNNNPEVTNKGLERFNEEISPLFMNLEAFSFQVQNTKVSDGLKKILAQKEQDISSKQQQQ